MEKIQTDLKTPRLTLSLLKKEDGVSLFHILKTHPEITRFLTFDPPENQEQTDQFIAATLEKIEAKTDFAWTVSFHEKIIGVIGLHNIKWQKLAWKYDGCTLGYWLNPDYHRQGFMHEAAQAVLRFGFEDLKLHKITVEHVTGNVASEKLIQKLGFRLVGEPQKHIFRYEKWWDYKIWEMLEEEWFLKHH